jgi:hypothetical protein
MVSTRRTAAAPAEPAQDMPETQRAVDAPVTRARPKRGRAPSAAKPAEPAVTISEATAVATATTATSTTSSVATLTKSIRRTRSKQTADASPLKSLDDGSKENASSGRTPARKATPKPATLKTKRKHNASRYNTTSASATPEPETAQRESAQDDSNDDQGMFFTQSMPQISSIPPLSTLIAFSQGAEHDSVSTPNDSISLKNDSVSPKNDSVSPKAEPAITEHVPADSDEVALLRDQLVKANKQIEALRYLLTIRDHEILQLNQFRTGQVQANASSTDIDQFGINNEPQHLNEPQGDYNDGGLLEHILAAKRAPRTVQPNNHNDNESDQDMEASPQPLRQSLTQRESQTESSRNTAEVTPSRPISKPSSFFSRSYSAIKSKLGWSTPTPPEPSPAAPSTSRAPPPDTFTEVLSAPPTPVGERRKTRPRKNKQNPMLKLLTKGVEPDDMAKAEEWARNTIPTLKNYPDFAAKRKRLETPVLVQDLEHLPASKPWESGFGDPLGDMDDEDVVPVWAVVLGILTEEEEPKRKKTKASHEVSMDIDDTLSINDMAEQRLHDSHGHSASQLDFHPRRSVEPSPMFGTPSPHQHGSNVFDELHGLQTNDRESLHEATKDVVHNHNPSQGSFGLDYGSDDEDSTILEETSNADASASPLWTQAPPPAPVPAHAPLPGGSPAGTPAVATDMPSPPAEQPVDEVERQRQKLMKHTPAKPSRLREAFVPSPSVLSDAGNQSLFLGTPAAATAGLYEIDFDDMPEAEEIELTAEEWAGVQAITSSAEWKAATARAWPDPIMEYDSEEEDLSPV